MNKPNSQELLPPASEGPSTPAGWLQWLVDPLPQRFLLPATGLLMVGLDWLLFPEEAASVGLATPITSVIGFLLGSFGAYVLQRKYGLNERPAALFKALLAGFFVGVPFPLTGTLVGGWVLATSGLADLWRRMFKGGPFRR
jgi:hypothetical protein